MEAGTMWMIGSAAVSVLGGVMGSQASKKQAAEAEAAARKAAFFQRMSGDVLGAITSMEAELMIDQSKLIIAEGKLEKGFMAKEDQSFLALQKMSYIAGGLDLAGSPLLAVHDAIITNNIEMEAFQSSYEAKAEMLETQASITKAKAEAGKMSAYSSAIATEEGGKNTAEIYENQAMSQLVGGVGGAVKTVGSYYNRLGTEDEGRF
jgi:hypothetical protein